MNKRIKELAALCRTEYRDDNGGYVDQFDEDKFAELIIRECLNQCFYRGMNDELYEGQLRAAMYIEQHFGIEE